LGNVDEPPSLHRYSYALNNPLVFVDPDGNESVRQAWGVDDPQGFWSALGKNLAYNTWNAISVGTLGRQDELVEQYEAGLITDSQYWGRTTVNAASGVAIAGAAAATGGAAAGLAQGLGAGATATGLLAGATGGVAAQGATDLIEVLGTGTKSADEVRGRDYLVAAATGGALGGLGGAVAARPSAVRLNLNPNIRGLAALDDTVVQRGAQGVQSGLSRAAELGYAGGQRATTIVESALGVDAVPTPWGAFRSRTTGRFVSPRSSSRLADPVDDFIAQAETNNFRVLGREVKVRTPFGERRPDVVLQNRETLEIGGVELKSSLREFSRLNPQQFAADRWINRFGAPTFGTRASQAGVQRIDSTVKILWPSRTLPPEIGILGLGEQAVEDR
jgi:hypothetical protein